MKKKWAEGRAIYIQIMEIISGSIASGELKPGQRVPAVRDYAVSFGVNPNTMQRALYELEREGILISERNTGRFVTEDDEIIKKMKENQAENAFEEFYIQMRTLGFSEKEMMDFFCERLGKHRADAGGRGVC